MNPTFPTLAGCYALQLELMEAARLAIGRLGVFNFPAGRYLYLGSAFGPGGLAGRLRHHLSPLKKAHWHIDYLRVQARVSGLGYVCASVGGMEPADTTLRLECQWSQQAANIAGISVPAPGFGASDCVSGCAAHLYRLPSHLSPEAVAACLKAGGAPVSFKWTELINIE